jgi:hypothetical protein
MDSGTAKWVGSRVVTTSHRRPSSRVVRQHRLTAAVAVLALATVVVAVVVLFNRSGSPSARGAQSAQTAPSLQLPRGGRRLLPDYRIVAYYGAPQDRQLGALGIGTPAHAAARLARQAKPYASRTRPALPAMELLAVIAHGEAGRDGKYRLRQSNATIRRYLHAARKAKALLVLDIQPGRSDFFTETRRLERWLREPDVGLALDPEWHVAPGQVPGKVIGSVGAREVNATSAWLAQLVAKRKLPQKLFLVHQFTPGMVPVARLKQRAGLATVINVDGFGGQAVKIAKYRSFARVARAHGFRRGFKLFYEEDTKLMQPGQVLRLGPPPDVVVYE